MQVVMLHFPAELIIARVEMESDKEIRISRPTFAVIDPVKGGVAIIEPIWSIGSVEEEFTFKKGDGLLQVLTPEKRLEEAYLKATTIIDIPTSGGPKLVK